MSTGRSQFWVFGYGSLMWRPGFEYIRSVSARLDGYHRALCVYSHVHRGTPQTPGLVFGLDHGGSCTGIAFQVEEKNWQATVSYLRAREQVTAVYEEIQVVLQTAETPDQPAHKLTALTYRVNTSHRQYAGRLSMKDQLAYVKQGMGQSGHCRDYVLATAEHLVELGVEDPDIQALARALSEESQAPS